MNNEFSLVYCTCDAYEDLWDNFFKLLKKYWPEFDAEIIFNTEQKKYDNPYFNIKHVENNNSKLSWSDRLANSLLKTKSDYILLFLDDYYLRDRVDNEKFLLCLKEIRDKKNIASITFLKEPGISSKKSDIGGGVLL